jgi:hypothetical protein
MVSHTHFWAQGEKSLPIRNRAKERVPKSKRKVRDWIRYSIWIGGSALILFLIVLIIKTAISPTPSLPSEPGRRKAVIVDQIAVLQPNQEFTDTALTYLRDAGFDVEVYEGEDITVEFYKTLSASGYELIVFRTHSSSVEFVDEVPQEVGPVFLFTGEPHNKQRYILEHLTDQIRATKILYDESSVFFAVGPEFVKRSMAGRFDDTLIIIGGCQSMTTLDLARALVERGASAVIGWDTWVDLSHNDKAILRLLHALTAENLTVRQAVEKTMGEIGPDPSYESVLTYFPLERGGYVLPGQANSLEER